MLAGTGVTITWHETLSKIPEGPLLVVANEFFDALPVRQYVATDRGWCERLIGLDGDALAFGLGPEPEPSLGEPAQAGEICEAHVAAAILIREIAGRLVRDGGGALVIDYGYWGPALGDTLQAVRHHAFVDPLAEPGEADLATHVDFAQLAHAARACEAIVHGIDTQGNFTPCPWSRHASRASEAAREARAGQGNRRGRRAIDRQRGTGHGRTIQGSGLHASRENRDGSRSASAPGSHKEVTDMYIEAPELASYPNLKHAFFTREGGVSEGIYASLNGGLGSSDDPRRVAENRRRMARTSTSRPSAPHQRPQNTFG